MRPRLALALVVGSALVLVALAARGTSPVTYTDRGGGGDDAPPPPPAPPEDLEVDARGSVATGSLTALLIVVVAVAVIVVVGLLLTVGWRRRPRRGVGAVVASPDVVDGLAEPPPLLVRRAGEALAQLREHPERPPGDAVIAAWLTLERAAEDSGVPRRPHQTPTEFTGDLLLRYRVDEDATGALRRVYQRARFGTAAVTPADVRTATEALERVVRDLR